MDTGERPNVVGLLARSILASVEGRRSPLLLPLLLLLMVVALGGAVYTTAAPVVAETEPMVAAAAAESGSTDQLIERANQEIELWKAVERYVEREVAPIENVLLRYRDDRALARRVALALVREARATELEPRLLLAVLLVENPWIDPEASSPVGAKGLMQVMPLHRGKWPPCEPDLSDIEANICHGARIFAHYFRREGGNVERALLRYNGCVNGTNTPDCQRYPYHVYARAGRASILAWLKPRSSGAAAP